VGKTLQQRRFQLQKRPPGNCGIRPALGANNSAWSIWPRSAQNEVAGYAEDGSKNATMKSAKDNHVMQVSTVEYNLCGWRAWLNGTTITLGVNNVFDLAPPS